MNRKNGSDQATVQSVMETISEARKNGSTWAECAKIWNKERPLDNVTPSAIRHRHDKWAKNRHETENDKAPVDNQQKVLDYRGVASNFLKTFVKRHPLTSRFVDSYNGTLVLMLAEFAESNEATANKLVEVCDRVSNNMDIWTRTAEAVFDATIGRLSKHFL